MYRIAARGLLVGIIAFSAIILAEPLELHGIFYAGAAGVGLGGGLFAVGTMLGAMGLSDGSDSGIVVGAWSAVQATAIGCSLLAGGAIKNGVNALALDGRLGEAMVTRAAGYLTVYALEILLLFVCLAVLGPLTGRMYRHGGNNDMRFGLAEMPG
jgi:BCD family chlorophyll transporter-like MFS transporter